MEIPTLDGGKHYPLPFKKEQLLAKKYLDELPEGVFSIGRAGTYLYGVDIDDCIRQAMIMKEEIKNGTQSNPVPGVEYHFPELKNE